MRTTAIRVVPHQKPLASSRYITWRIKGAKIMDILPRYPANMYRFYLYGDVRNIQNYEKSYDAKSCRISGQNV